MSVKIDQIIKPFSAGFTALSTRQLIEDLTNRYMITEPEMSVRAFKDKNDYFVYATLPSKTNDKYGIDKIYYDVVFQLTPPNYAYIDADNIRNWDVRVFCNNPSFMFNFTYVYYHKNALIKLPNGYYGRLALKNKPKIRNPLLLLGIEENLWFTVMYLDKHKLFDKGNIDNLCASSGDLDFKQLLKLIVPQEKKLKEINDRGARHRNNQLVEKEKEKLTKNEKERLARLEKENRRETGKANDSRSILNSNRLRNSNFSDLSSNIKSDNKSQLAIKNNEYLNKKKNKLKSTLRSSL